MRPCWGKPFRPQLKSPVVGLRVWCTYCGTVRANDQCKPCHERLQHHPPSLLLLPLLCDGHRHSWLRSWLCACCLSTANQYQAPRSS